MERKKAIRKILLTRRDQLSREKRASDSAVIHKELFSHPRFREAAVIYLYASYGSEVETEQVPETDMSDAMMSMALAMGE